MNNGGRQMRFSDVELQLIKSTFAGNEDLLKLMRKVFLPEITPDAPLGQNVDLWMTLNIKEMDPQTAIVNLMARNEVIQHVDQQLLQLNFLAGIKEETVEETKDRLTKDSAK